MFLFFITTQIWKSLHTFVMIYKTSGKQLSKYPLRENINPDFPNSYQLQTDQPLPSKI